MKRLLLIAGLIVHSTNGFATEWMTFFIYVQTEYEQGIWSGERLFKNGNNNYLEARQQEGLFGYGPEANLTIIDSIFLKLKREDPDRINFKYALSSSNDYDTVIISAGTKIQEFEAVKNELVASYLLNSFVAVRINQPGSSRIYGLKDISVPYMDLKNPFNATIPPDVVFVRRTDTIYQKTNTSDTSKTGSGLSTGFIFSVAANIFLVIALAIILLRRRSKKPFESQSNFR